MNSSDADASAELIDSTGNVIPLHPVGAPETHDEADDDTVPVRGADLSSMRQVLRRQTCVYRLLQRKKISAAEAERHIKMLAVVFDELKFLDVESQIMERLARLEEARGLIR